VYLAVIRDIIGRHIGQQEVEIKIYQHFSVCCCWTQRG